MSTIIERESPGFRRISWGAIIAGTILTLVVQLMLGLLGLGIGLATIDPEAAGASPAAGALTSVSGIYTVLTVLVATFAGAYAAARFAGAHARRDAALHGITTWATATLLAVYLLTSGVSAVVGGTFAALGGAVQSLGSATASITPDSLDALPPQLRAQAEALLERGEQQAQAAGDQAEAAAQDAREAAGTQDLGAAASEIFAGVQTDATPEERQAAVSLIASQAGISEAEAEQRLTQFQGQYEQAVTEARQAAGTAADALSGAAFAAFVALLLGAIVAALGGIVGRPERVHPLYRD
ncbi:PhnA-like protein [Aureimonas populi]|uniref:PhnA-like protein n=1 Tax=Aureimonas populi TaxID=1701758 RepID=A0ABW5CGK7_9HYPH|nr:PhnA-like protein [Aureimonas populi]